MSTCARKLAPRWGALVGALSVLVILIHYLSQGYLATTDRVFIDGGSKNWYFTHPEMSRLFDAAALTVATMILVVIAIDGNDLFKRYTKLLKREGTDHRRWDGRDAGAGLAFAAFLGFVGSWVWIVAGGVAYNIAGSLIGGIMIVATINSSLSKSLYERWNWGHCLDCLVLVAFGSFCVAVSMTAFQGVVTGFVNGWVTFFAGSVAAVAWSSVRARSTGRAAHGIATFFLDCNDEDCKVAGHAS